MIPNYCLQCTTLSIYMCICFNLASSYYYSLGLYTDVDIYIYTHNVNTMRISFIAALFSILILTPTIIFAQQLHTFQGIHDKDEGENTTVGHDDEKMLEKNMGQENSSSNTKNSSGGGGQIEVMKMITAGHPLQVAGSRLPDCSHACGSCTPCRLVMVRFVCASLTEAETCPISYRCMCNGKSYPVP